MPSFRTNRDQVVSIIMKPVLRFLMGVIVLPTQDEIDLLIATVAMEA